MVHSVDAGGAGRAPARPSRRSTFPDIGRKARVEVERVQHELRFSWVIRQGLDEAEHGSLVLDLQAGHPLIRAMGGRRYGMGRRVDFAILENADPVTLPAGRQPRGPRRAAARDERLQRLLRCSGQRPFQTFRSKLDLKRVRVTSKGRRTTVAIGDLTIGPFTGELQLTVYDRCSPGPRGDGHPHPGGSASDPLRHRTRVR